MIKIETKKSGTYTLEELINATHCSKGQLRVYLCRDEFAHIKRIVKYPNEPSSRKPKYLISYRNVKPKDVKKLFALGHRINLAAVEICGMEGW